MDAFQKANNCIAVALVCWRNLWEPLDPSKQSASNIRRYSLQELLAGWLQVVLMNKHLS
jgi:hypothetical protein